MKPLLLTILICLISLTAFAQDATTQATPQEVPTHCPECKVKLNKVSIVYGMHTQEIMDAVKRGEIIYGGEDVYYGDEPPNYAFICPKCKKTVGQYLILQTKQDIKMQYGEPFYKGGHKKIEIWHYPQQRMFIFFEGDKVVRIDVVTGEKI